MYQDIHQEIRKLNQQIKLLQLNQIEPIEKHYNQEELKHNQIMNMLNNHL